jgi:hypothetical protein
MDYPHLSYERLAGMRQILEALAQEGEAFGDVQRQLAAVKTEMETRKFRLVGRWDGQHVKEYGRWQTAQQCENHAEQLGLPVGAYELRGKPFEMLVMELA